MYNDNNFCSRYSFSQRNLIPKSNTIFASSNYSNNYYYNKNLLNNMKKKFNDFEINKIIESCKKNLKKLHHTVYDIKKDPSIYNKENYQTNVINRNISSSLKMLPNTNKNNQKNIYTYYLGNNNDYSTNINQINKNKINIIGYNNKALTSRNNKINRNISYKDEYFHSDYYNSNEYYDDIINNSQKNFKSILTQRDNFKNKNNYNHKSYKNILNNQTNNNIKVNKTKNRNKQNNNKIYTIEQQQYNKNYLTLVNDLEELKSTVVNYKKTNLELKQQIERLNNKINLLSNKNRNIIINNNNEKEIEKEKEKNIKDKCYIKKRINSYTYKGKIINKEKNLLNNDNNTIDICNNVCHPKLDPNNDFKYNLYLEKENKKNENNINSYYNCLNDMNYIQNQNQNNFQNNKKDRGKYKSRNLSNDFKYAKNNTPNVKDEITSSMYLNNNNNNSEASNNNNYGKIINISEILYNKTSNSMNNNSNNNISNYNNNSPKDEIIEKKVLLKKTNNDLLKNFFGTTSCSSNPDINELYKMTKNNISNMSNINKSHLQKNEILINMSRFSLDKNNNNNKKYYKNKSTSNLKTYIYHKKTRTHSYNRKDNENIKENNESYNKIGIIKLPINRINITPVRNSEDEESKSSRINDAIQSIDMNNFKNNKNAILQRLLQKNQRSNRSSMTVSEMENSSVFLYGIDNKNNLIQFDIVMKQYTKLKIYELKDLSNSFYSDYIYNSSIILNTLKGVYILTGINSNLLYFYNTKIKSMSKICTFIYSHYKGSLLFDEERKRIFAFSGKNNTKCEYYSFKTNKIIEMPDINIDRINASYFITNNKIYCFFGYSYNNKKYVNSIEYIDYEELDKWENKYINNNLDFNIERCANIVFKEDINQVYLYIEGKKNKENKIRRMLWLCYIDKEEINIINNLIIDKYKENNCIWLKTKEHDNDNVFYFDKCFNFVELPTEINNNYFENNFDNIAVILDNKNNAYFFYKNQMKIEIYRK